MKLLASLIAAGAIVIAVVGCGGDDDSTSTAAGDTAASGNAEASAPEKQKSKPKVTVPDGPPPTKLVEKELEPGSGAEAKSGDQVTVQYVGVNYKSGDEFDASWDRGEPFTFTLGTGGVIAGWDQGVEGMKVGGRRELIIPPELGYGPEGSAGAIPPNETLIFVIDLLAVG